MSEGLPNIVMVIRKINDPKNYSLKRSTLHSEFMKIYLSLTIIDMDNSVVIAGGRWI